MNKLKATLAFVTVVSLGGITSCASNSPAPSASPAVSQGETKQEPTANSANSRNAYAQIPADQITESGTSIDFFWDPTDPYYGFNSVPVVARVHIDSIDGGRTYDPINKVYTFPATYGKLTVTASYKGTVKPGTQLTYIKMGGTVTFDDWWKSLNPQQQEKWTARNGGTKPTSTGYIRKTVEDDVELTIDKEYVALLIPRSSADGTMVEYVFEGFQLGLREVKGTGASATVLNNETNEWESIGTMVKLP